MYINDTNVSIFYFYYPPDSQESNINYARIFLRSVWLVIACNYIRRTRCEKYWTCVRHVLALFFSRPILSPQLSTFFSLSKKLQPLLNLLNCQSFKNTLTDVYLFFLNDNCVINTSKEAGFMYRDKMKYIYKWFNKFPCVLFTTSIS